MSKLVSLLLTTYNSESVIRKTLDSIDKQDYPDIEICVADSCSTDSTLDIINEYAANSRYKVVVESKKDSGIYEGLNNSLKLTHGDYIQVMNDELVTTDAISKLVAAIEEAEKEKPGKEVLGAHSDLVYAEDGKVIRYWKMGQGKIRSGWMPAHPTLMLKRETYEKYGNYDISYVCSADYEFMVRILKSKGILGYVPEVLVSMYYGGTSNSSWKSYVRSINEAIHALCVNKVRPALWITGLRTIRVALQFVNRNKDIN